MASTIKAVVFDLDGTLFDSRALSKRALVEGFDAFWRELGENGPVPPWEIAETLIGLPTYEFFPSLLPPEYRHHWKLLHRCVFEAECRGLRDSMGKTFDGVHDVLAALLNANVILACLSNSSQGYFDSVLDSCDLRKYFHRLVCLGEKPTLHKAGILSQWVEEFGGGNAIVYVGDRKTDIEAARAAGVYSVAVTFGYGKPEELQMADAVINSMRELPSVLARFGLFLDKIPGKLNEKV